jgi:hypothetical protein
MKTLYKKRDFVMNKSEEALFFALERLIPQGYYIFPNMRLADFIDAIHGNGFIRRRNNILPKHVDFLVCNKYFNPIFAIELNGNSHLRPDRIKRDKLVNEIFEEAGLGLETINVGDTFNDEVSKIVSKYHLLMAG